MNTLHLKYAVEVERTGSIIKAAQNLYMNQPHLSKAIRELEETVGITIFNRTSKGVIPTKKGEEFLMHAKDVLARIELMENLYKPDGDSKLRFDISVPRAAYISGALAEFTGAIDSGDGIEIDYRETNSLRTINNVALGENNLGIIRFQTVYEKYFINLLEEKDLIYETLWEFESLVLMSNGHPLAGHQRLDLAMLKDYIEVACGDHSIPSLPLSKAKQLRQNEEKKKKIAVYERASQLELIKKVPGCYMWSSPMSEEDLSRHSLVQKKCPAPENSCKDLLIYRQGYRLTGQDEKFISILHERVNK